MIQANIHDDTQNLIRQLMNISAV